MDYKEYEVISIHASGKIIARCLITNNNVEVNKETFTRSDFSEIWSRKSVKIYLDQYNNFKGISNIGEYNSCGFDDIIY